MSAEAELQPSETSAASVEGYAKTPVAGARVKATGVVALYVALLGVALWGISSEKEIPATVVYSGGALVVAALLFGRDVAGANYRRLEKELQHKDREIARLSDERNRLQGPHVRTLRSSRRGNR